MPASLPMPPWRSLSRPSIGGLGLMRDRPGTLDLGVRRSWLGARLPAIPPLPASSCAMYRIHSTSCVVMCYVSRGLPTTVGAKSSEMEKEMTKLSRVAGALIGTFAVLIAVAAPAGDPLPKGAMTAAHADGSLRTDPALIAITPTALATPLALAACAPSVKIKDYMLGTIVASASFRGCRIIETDRLCLQKETSYHTWTSVVECRGAVWMSASPSGLDTVPGGCNNAPRYAGKYRAYAVINGRGYSSPIRWCVGHF